MKEKKRLSFLFCVILVLTALAIPFSFSYWLMPVFGAKTDTYARFLFDFADSQNLDDPYDRLISIGTPASVIDELKQLEGDLTEFEFELFIEALEAFVSSLTDYQDYYDNIFLAKSAQTLFSGGAVVGQNDVIILLTISEDSGQPEILMVHVHPDFTFAGRNEISDETTFWQALSAPYSNIYGHYISNVFIQGNRYTRRHAPVEIGGNHYLFLGNGWGDYSPETGGEWRKVLNDEYEHDPFNRSYFEGAIVKWPNGNYYIARRTTWNPAPSGDWTLIQLYSSMQTYDVGQVVHTLDANQKPHFYRANVGGVKDSPSIASCESGQWQELDHRWGWVGDSTSTSSIRSLYVSHNTYKAGDLVIYGTSPTFRYRYYVAKKDVPATESPLIYNYGEIPRLNSEYWEPIYSYDN